MKNDLPNTLELRPANTKQLYRFIRTKIGKFSILEMFKSFSQIGKIGCSERTLFFGVSKLQKSNREYSA